MPNIWANFMSPRLFKVAQSGHTAREGVSETGCTYKLRTNIISLEDRLQNFFFNKIKPRPLFYLHVLIFSPQVSATNVV